MKNQTKRPKLRTHKKKLGLKGQVVIEFVDSSSKGTKTENPDLEVVFRRTMTANRFLPNKRPAINNKPFLPQLPMVERGPETQMSLLIDKGRNLLGSYLPYLLPY